MTLRVVSEPPAVITVAFAAEAEATKLAATVANAAPARTTRLNKGLFTALGPFLGTETPSMRPTALGSQPTQTLLT
ncbi:unannotated protein [freshwater metagenome]|uniref:Unannotated protein n=1 Tax=freshwater metagenome TaxID=449393 RepID=A0A6J6IUS0_9ZZZZ